MKAAETVAIRGVSVTRLGLGTAPLGGLFTSVADEAAHATVDAAWQLGLRFFDTAPLYGYGSAERRLGLGLARRPRAEFALATKVGRLLRDPESESAGDRDDTQQYHGESFYKDIGTAIPMFDFSGDAVLRALEESLTRLGTDRVDIVHVHDPDNHVDQAIRGAYPALLKLREQGVIGAVGLGIDFCEPAVKIMQAVDLDCVLIAGRWTLLDRSAGAALLPLAAERGIAVIAAGVFNSGLLADPEAANATFDYVPAPADIRTRARALARACARHDVPLKAAALQFPYQHRAVAAVLTGARSPEEITENVAMLEVPIPDALWTALERELDLATSTG